MTKPGETITVVDDEGLPHDFTLVEVVEIDDRRYAVLQPEDLEAGAVLFRVEGETMTPVDDDEEFDQVVEALRDLDEYDDLVVEHRGKDDADDDDEDEDDEAEDDDEEPEDEETPEDDLDEDADDELEADLDNEDAEDDEE
jgi:hypothetical protein